MKLIKLYIDYSRHGINRGASISNTLGHSYIVSPSSIKRDPKTGLWKIYCIDNKTKSKMTFFMDTLKKWETLDVDIDNDSSYGTKKDL